MFFKNIFKRKKKRKELVDMKADMLFDDFLEELKNEVYLEDDPNLNVCFVLHPEEDGVDSKALRLGGINLVHHSENDVVVYFDLFDDVEEK